MIAAWMLFAILITALFGVAAVAAEQAASALRLPTRFVWIGALLAATLWPVIAIVGAGGHAEPASAAGVLVIPFVVGVERASAFVAAAPVPHLARVLDVGLLAVWGALTALLLVRFSRALRTLRHRRGAWRSAQVDGVSVRLSADVGPAVVGLRPMEIVLPEWTLALDRPLRAMVLRHEEEHRSARDPHLLVASIVLIALMPWNIPMWWLARRLRLAIELDCDARVLRAHPRPERYGLLLLTIAQRHAGITPRFSPALSEPTSHLERRIIAMRNVASRFTRTRVLAFGASAAAAIAIACSVPAPDSATGPDAGAQLSADLHVRISAGRKGSNSAAPMNDSGAQRTYIDYQVPQPARPLPGNPLPAYPSTLAYGSSARRGTPVNTNQTYYSFQVEKQTQPVAGNLPPTYPSTLESARAEGEVLVQFVVDTTGQVDMSQFKVLKASDPLFVDAVKRVIPEWKFSPANVGGYKVKQLVQMPFTFKVP